jgi:hypothetical protein
MNNHWENITFGAQRRIDSKSKYNFFWICDISGHYGLFINTDNELPLIESSLQLKGISIINRNVDSGKGELILILKNNSDWELFLKLCNDLITVSEKCISEEKMVMTIYNRLKKWQAFLKQNSSSCMTLSEQMGLYTELYCLYNHILPNNTPLESIKSWTGPDFDKQDFSMDNKLVEVKSYLSSKGAIITISSMYQLDNNGKDLYLLVYGLTLSENGYSIPELAESIESTFGNADNIEALQNKIAAYGYIPGVTEPPFYKFSMDKEMVFRVGSDFPKIISQDVSPEINSVIYTLDITKCLVYETTIISIFKN